MEDEIENNLSADQIHALESAEEAALLADEGPQAGADEAPSEADLEAAPQLEAEEPVPQENILQAEDKTKTPPEVAADDKPRGDTRAALKAARRSEHRAKNEVARLRAENAALREQVPAQASTDTDGDTITDDDIAELAAEIPVLGKFSKALKAFAASAKPTPTQATQQVDPEFEPPVLPPELQDKVDQIPELLEWQYDPDQTLFELAKAEDRKLSLLPKWKDVSEEERFAEVVRRVKAEFAEPAAAKPDQKPRVNVADAIANAPRLKPNTLADIGGGGDNPTSVSNLGRYSQMTDEDIEADLLMS